MVRGVASCGVRLLAGVITDLLLGLEFVSGCAVTLRASVRSDLELSSAKAVLLSFV